MARKTIHVPYDKVKKLLAEGKSYWKISQALNLPGSTVRKIKAGAVIHETFRLKKLSGDDLCTSCGVRSKEPDFRYLCLYCFRNAGNETVYSVNTKAMRVAQRGSKPNMS